MAAADVIDYERTSGCASAPLHPWRRRQPETTTLWKLVAAHLQSVRAGLAASGRTLPAHVLRELRGYLDCGLLERGFARVACRGCKTEILVAFSCRGRGLCPSCTTRRMHDTAAHLVDRVLPWVPVRQWVITFPRRVRCHLAYDPRLATAAMTLCLRVLFAWQRRRAREAGVRLGAPVRSQSARSAAVVFIQRFDSSLALDFHLHVLVPDGVFTRERQDPDARPRFCRLSPPTDDDVAMLLRRIVSRVENLARLRAHDAVPDPDDVSAQLHLLAATPLVPHSGGSSPPPRLCARQDGYSLHAATAIHEKDRLGLERLARYCARPALSLERLSVLADGRLRYRMKRAFSDGRSEVVLEPDAFLLRLCALIPPPHAHQVHYFGAFAARARGRSALVGRRAQAPTLPAAAVPPTSSVPSPSPVPTAGAPAGDADRPRRLDWASLLYRVCSIDVLQCARCGGRLRVLAFLTHRPTVHRILAHLAIPFAVRPVARPPPQPSFDFVDPPAWAGP